MRRPICIDLFSGAGGLALGFEQAGFDVVSSVEFDPIHAATHKLNFPEASVICSDIREVSGDNIRRAAKIGNRAVDAVIGGPPCQGFSLIGYRVLSDPRNELVFHYLRIVDELRPRIFMFENVAGMATGQHHALLDELIEGFEEIGYRVRKPFRILNAANYGVPQDRRRLILLGARNGTKLPEYPLATTRVRNRRNGNVETGSFETFDIPLCPSVGDAISDLPDIDRFPSLLETDVLKASLRPASEYALRLRGESEDPDDYSYRRNHDPSVLTGCLRAEHTEVSRRRFSKTVPGDTEPISRFYRLPEDGVCNTLRAGTASDRGAFTSPRPIHPRYTRCISVREAARLHSYPDWFRFHKTIWHGFRQIGNSVPPLLARAIASAVVDALGAERIRPLQTLNLGPENLVNMTMKEAAAFFGVDPGVIPGRQRARKAA